MSADVVALIAALYVHAGLTTGLLIALFITESGTHGVRWWALILAGFLWPAITIYGVMAWIVERAQSPSPGRSSSDAGG